MMTAKSAMFGNAMLNGSVFPFVVFAGSVDATAAFSVIDSVIDSVVDIVF